MKRKLRKQVLEAIVNVNREADPRAFAEIIIGNLKIIGLLDTGASVSLLGKNCRELITNVFNGVNRGRKTTSCVGQGKAGGFFRP